MNKIVMLFFVLFGLAGTAQELKNEFGDVYYTADLYKKDNDLVEGSPYLDEQFKPAKINDIGSTKLVRLNALNHQVEILVGPNSVMVMDDSDPYTIRMQDGSNRVYVNKDYREENGEVKKSFFLVIKDTDGYCLFEREEIKFYKAVKAEGYQASQPPQYKKEQSTFYLLDKSQGRGILAALPTRTKKFVEHFPDRSRELNGFIKEEKVNLYEAEDLIKVLGFYYREKPPVVPGKS